MHKKIIFKATELGAWPYKLSEKMLQSFLKSFHPRVLNQNRSDVQKLFESLGNDNLLKISKQIVVPKPFKA